MESETRATILTLKKAKVLSTDYPYMFILESVKVCSLNQPEESNGQPNYTKGQKLEQW